MIVIVAALLGIGIGAWTATRRNGNRKDIAQYAAGYGIAFTLAGVVATIIIHRMLV